MNVQLQKQSVVEAMRAAQFMENECKMAGAVLRDLRAAYLAGEPIDDHLDELIPLQKYTENPTLHEHISTVLYELGAAG